VTLGAAAAAFFTPPTVFAHTSDHSMIRLHRTLPVVLIGALVLLIGGCDSAGTGEETIVLNANSPQETRPVASYEFEYRVEGPGTIEVTSLQSDNLDQILSNAAASRSDITAAEVDSVRLLGLSPQDVAAKVFPYLNRVEVYLGTDDTGTQIAEQVIRPNPPPELTLRTSSLNVTSTVKEGRQPAFLRLDAQDGTFPRTDRVEVEVYYTLRLDLGT
jgi:hypothetical protein